jgi:chromosome segregation ATPase
MTMSPGELDRKVRQLDHDVMSIYELLHGISAQQGRLLTRLEGLDAAIGTRLDAHDARLDRIEGRLGAIEGRLGAHDSRFDSMENRLGAMEGRLDSMDNRLGAMEGRLGAHDTRFDLIDSQLAEILCLLRAR